MSLAKDLLQLFENHPNTNILKTLKDYGWKHKDKGYQHPDLPGHTLYIKKAKWNAFAGKKTGGGEIHHQSSPNSLSVSTVKETELKNFLNKLHGEKK
jgi:acyl-CoA-binding protein